MWGSSEFRVSKPPFTDTWKGETETQVWGLHGPEDLAAALSESIIQQREAPVDSTAGQPGHS